MPQFVLIDHSLKDVGGHHFDYAVHALRAAGQLGFEPVVATHRGFRGQAKLPAGCRVLPIFRFHTYNRYTLFSGDRHRLIDPQVPPPHAGDGTDRWNLKNGLAGLRTWWRELKELKHRGGAARRMRDLSRGCAKLFRQITLQPGDHVFLPTTSEVDLLGLVDYLESDPRSRCADWHFQFHFNFFDGREPEFPDQPKRLEQMRSLFAGALRSVPHHRVHCYNTSHELTRQYNLLGVSDFANLAYPINPAFYTGVPGRVADGPLRVTCAGAVRAEKGQAGLRQLADSLWTEYLEPGRLQLVVQSESEGRSNRAKFQLPLPKQPSSPPQVRLPRETCHDPVAYIRYPLGLEDYADFVGRADIGLLLYDSRRYYTRRAGVMGELLAAGVPVIVPAGCWLAEQIAEPIYRHQLSLESRLPIVGRICPGDISWTTPVSVLDALNAACTELACGDEAAPAECWLEVPEGARELLATFDWNRETPVGVYLQVRAESLAVDGRVLEQFTTIVGQRDSQLPVPALFHVGPDAAQIRLTCCNAYHDSQLSLGNFGATWLGGRRGHGHVPSGAVGLIAADAGHAARLLREMCDHYGHYRQSAEEFSHGWFATHDPLRTIEQLTGVRRDAAVPAGRATASRAA